MRIVFIILLWMALIMAAAGVSDAKAEGETWLTLSCCSKHWPRDNGFNEDNRGAFLTHHFKNKTFLTMGGYRNSQDRQSAIGGLGFEVFSGRVHHADASFNVAAVLVNGYGKTYEDWQKWNWKVLPIYNIRGERMGVKIMGIPGYLLGLGFDFRLD